MNNQNNRGRGWHGDSEAHARAGRKGGQARSKKSQSDKRGSDTSQMSIDRQSNEFNNSDYDY